MSKNLTRKGLAFGALVALSSSLIAGAPANAIGEDGNVTLAPNAGTEYSVLAGSTFDLKANYSNAVAIAGHNLKFLVTDTAATSKFDLDVNGATADANTVPVPTAWTATAGTAGTTNTDWTVVVTAAAHGFKIGDAVTFAGLATTGTMTTMNGAKTLTGATADTMTFVVTVANAVTAGGYSVSTPTATGSNTDGLVAADLVATRALGSRNIIGSTASVGARKADNSYVINTGTANFNTSNTVLRLINTDPTTSATYTVTAWIDDNSDGLVDANESKSVVRTVKFLTNADIATTTTVRPVSVGDTTLTADVVTVPVLNGDQISAGTNPGYAAALAVDFTRQGSTKTLRSLAASTAWNDTTKKWTVVSALMSATTGADYVGNTGTANLGWAIEQPLAVSTGDNVATSAIKADVVTLTTAAAHGLQVGDTVIVTGLAKTAANFTTGAGATVSSVPTATSFTYVVKTAGATDVAASADAVTDALTVPVALRNSVVSGNYSAQAKLASYTALVTYAFASAGTKAAVAVGASSADTVTLAGVSSANVSAAGAVRVGTTTINASAEVLDEDGAAVAAGIDATITVGGTLTGAGVFTVNGTTVVAGTVVTAKTNAAGKVDVVITNSSALADNAITLTVRVQGNDSNTLPFTWSKAVYSIVDLADANADVISVVSSADVYTKTAATVRSAAVGGTHTFNLLAQDQWKTALADATVRVHAASTTRTVFDTFITPVAGKFSVAVADGAASATATATVSITFQKLIDGIWSETEGGTAANDAAFVDSSAAAGEGDAFTVNFVTQTDKITLNANSANFPAVTTVARNADLAATVVAKALKAIDLRVTDGTATTYVAANKAVVAGVVANSTTGALRAGASVTAAGAGLLFNVGDVWALDSITWISNTGDFAVNVYSASSGDKKVTITSGAATSSSTVAFSGTATDKKVLTVTAPASVLAGATLSANILLVDGNGNAVDTVAPAATPVAAYIKVSYDGPGLLSGSLPTETDSDGKANVRYLTGVSDAGIATITVKYDQNFDGDFIDATDIVVVKTVTIGSAAVLAPKAAVAGVAGYVATTVRNSMGKAVTVTINGRVLTARAPKTDAQAYAFRTTSGKKLVVVKVDGVTVSSRTITVK